MNQVILVGRIVKFNKEENVNYVDIAVNRHYKNVEGVYETDFIECEIKGNIATNTLEYCKKGDVIGIKGALENRFNEDNKKINIVKVDKVSLLSNR